ncbi:MAG: hypothetical protein E7214_01425 [Clostridium sp.]|nr:hypothetical protein [Clostridium sp.]
MKKDITIFENALIEKKIYDEIYLLNEETIDYGLKLKDEEVKEILKTRKEALKTTGRIEFNGEIVTKIIKKFCDSPYISQYNYGESINSLVEIFYTYKNETLNYIGDDELIEIMKEHFDGYCEGSLELLEGKILYRIADNIRNGVKDYTDISDEKDF